MNSPDDTPRSLRVSLRELLLIVAFIALALAALKHANGFWTFVLSTGVVVGLMASSVAAFVDRGAARSMGIGFAVCVFLYGLLFWLSPAAPGQVEHRELDPHCGVLPTTKAMKPLMKLMIVRTWVDFKTGEEANAREPGAAISADAGFGWGGGAGGIGIKEHPPRTQFMVNGHLLWTLVFGYAGARFAGWLAAKSIRGQ